MSPKAIPAVRPSYQDRLTAAREGPVRLTSNENRMGLPQSVRKAIVEAFEDANIYPDDSGVFLTEALADRHGIEFEGIVHGHGSTDLLRMAVPSLAVGHSRIRLVMADPTFEQIAGYAEPYGVDLLHVPLERPSWAHDIDAMRQAVDEGSDPALVYICNPNNPTGSLTPVPPLEEWILEAPESHLFVIDEAYFEYVDDPRYRSLDRLAWERPNVVVLRTFSKIYAMAGLRVGYAVAHPHTAARLKQFKSGRGPSHTSNMAALTALADGQIIRRALDANRESKGIVLEVLDELGLGHIESHTNFVMHDVHGDVPLYVERMEEAGFLVGRPFPSVPSYNRVSLGTPAEMRSWADTLRSFRERGWV